MLFRSTRWVHSSTGSPRIYLHPAPSQRVWTLTGFFSSQSNRIDPGGLLVATVKEAAAAAAAAYANSVATAAAARNAFAVEKQTALSQHNRRKMCLATRCECFGFIDSPSLVESAQEATADGCRNLLTSYLDVEDVAAVKDAWRIASAFSCRPRVEGRKIVI